jgi:hypothetical protein
MAVRLTGSVAFLFLQQQNKITGSSSVEPLPYDKHPRPGAVDGNRLPIHELQLLIALPVGVIFTEL